MLALILSCRPAEDSAWTPPEFTGDGLPASEDTSHDAVQDTGTFGGGGGDDTGDLPAITVVDALFMWFDYGGYGFIGYLVLLTESLTCSELVDSTSYADGIYFYAYPPADVETAGWAASYPGCGSAPCSIAYYFLAGEFGYLDGGFTIEEYDAHYVTASWETEIGAGEGLRFYNCGDGEAWF